MYRIIGGDGREYGPVSEAQIRQWIAQNRANARTQLRTEDSTEWRTLAEFPDFAAALTARDEPPPLPTPAPAGVEAPAPAPTAKPPSPAVPRPEENPAQAALACASRSYTLSVLETLSRGWAIIVRRFGLTVGATTLIVLLSGLLGGIPYAGAIVTFGLQLVFIAGLYWVMLRVSRDEPATAADVFAGFTRAFQPLVVLSLVTSLALRALGLLALGPLLWQLHQHGWLNSSELTQVVLGGDPFVELVAITLQKGAMPDVSALVGPLLALPVLMVPLVYFSTAWIFAPMLVIDRGLAPLEALALSRQVASRRWFRLFFLNLAFFPLMIAGLLCFGVGVFVVLALSLASYTAAYEIAFGSATRRPSPSTDDD